MDFKAEIIFKVISYSITLACVQFALKWSSIQGSDLDLDEQGNLRITMEKYVKIFHILGIIYMGGTLLVSMIPQGNELLAKTVLTVMAFVGGILFLH